MSTEDSTSRPEDAAADHDVAPLGSVISDPPGDDGADGMAGPVFPPPETEPDAHRDRPASGG
jgi:hypothetical protein